MKTIGRMGLMGLMVLALCQCDGGEAEKLKAENQELRKRVSTLERELKTSESRLRTQKLKALAYEGVSNLGRLAEGDERGGVRLDEIQQELENMRKTTGENGQIGID